MLGQGRLNAVSANATKVIGVAAVVAAIFGTTAGAANAAAGTVDQLSPTYGPVGTVVDITGSGLSTASDVLFNATDAGAPSVIDDAHIKAVVPAGATTGPVQVTTADGAITGPTFTVQVPTSSTIAITRSDVVFPHEAQVTATLTTAGMPAGNQPAHLQRRVRGAGGWSPVQSARTTDSSGDVTWSVAPYATSAYRVVFGDTAAYAGTTSSRVLLHVHPLLSLHVPSVAPILTDMTLHGTIRPKPASGYVVLERRQAGGAWQRVGKTSVTERSRYSFTVSFDTTGGYSFRAFRPGDATHRSNVTKAKHLRAVQRSLSSGMTGPDVRALQHRLTTLHYDLAGVTGTYDYDTVHAVVAFEKIQGLDRDGVVGTSVWKALDDPLVPHLRHPQDARPAGLEVDLEDQVVLYAVNGKVRRILDSSTGGGYYYTGSDGTTQQAITPTGHFSVVYKRDGWVTSKLGTLYRPAYFNNSGYAVHGEGEVPSYPASHGCVRITVPAMDRLNAKLPIGLSIWIY
jgi:N-acetylmuramoyl-L-alanine amidase